MPLFGNIHRQQGGQVFVLALILLCFSSLMVVPVTNWLSVGLKATQVYQRNMKEIYAADTGIQYALWKVKYDPAIIDARQNSIYSQTYSYPALPVNNNSVAVTLTDFWLLADILNITNGAYPHNTWLGMNISGTTDPVVYTDTQSGQQYSIYTMSFTYNETGNKKIDRMGVWLPHGFTYFQGSSNNFSSNIDKHDPTVTPLAGGTSLIWEIHPNFNFGHGDTATQQFWFQPAGTTPKGAASWVQSQSSDIGYAWDNSIWWYEVTSVATDNATGKIPTVKVTAASDPGTPSGTAIITYSINDQ